MAEEAEDIKQEDDELGGVEAKEQKYKQETYRTPKCNIRIEELSKPKKVLVYSTYHGYKKILPERNKIAVLSFMEEEFAKTPEDLETNFKTLLRKAKENHCRKLCRKEARIKHYEKLNEKKRKRMLKLLREALKKHMTRAYFNPKQIIMTNRLRRISNTILKELCAIRGIPVPSRESTNIRASLMFAISDYFAFGIDTIYYELQVKKVRDYEIIKTEKREVDYTAVTDINLSDEPEPKMELHIPKACQMHRKKLIEMQCK